MLRDILIFTLGTDTRDLCKVVGFWNVPWDG